MKKEAFPMKKLARITILLAAAIAAGAMNANAYDVWVNLDRPFDPEVRSYSATVAHEVTEITVVAQARDASAKVTVNGRSPDTPVPLAVGENIIEVVVTAAEDRRAWLTYTVTVTREAAAALADGDGDPQPEVSANPHAALVAKVREWRDDPCCAHNPAHTGRWDRVLLAFGETVPDASLRPMGAAEAQGYADRGWTRWVEVAAALRQIEGGGSQTPAEAVPAVSIAAGDAVTEGTAAGFTLTAAPAAAADLSVSVTVAQSGAFAGASVLGARTVTIAAGAASVSFTVATVDDAADEPDGTVTAALASGVGYTVSASQGAATVAVADNDELLPVVSIAAGAAVTEGTPAGFTLTAAPAPAADLSVSVTVAQSGDFADAPVLGARTVTIAAGAASASFTVATVDDAADEPDGAVTATLVTGTGYTVSSSEGAATVAVSDDDTPVVSIAAGDAVTEGTPAGFTLTAAPAPAADLGVSVTVAQSGAFADAPVLGARTVTIAAGAASASFTVATVDDAVDEPDGTVTATLVTGTGYTVSPSEGAATVAVSDDDEPAPEILTDRSLARESDDAVVFRVWLSAAAAGLVTVDWATADGAGTWAGTAPATAGADYTAASGTLTFAAGETHKTVSVPILDDAIDEGIEYFLLRFSNPQGATMAAGHDETQGLIRNDDHLQAMWLARFGRTVGSQVTEAVTDRLDLGLAPGAHATLAGQSLDLSKADDGTVLAEAMTGLAQGFGAPADEDPLALHGPSGTWSVPGAAAPARSMTGRELLLGSSFHVAGTGAGSRPGLAAWGRVSQGGFDGEHADDSGRTSVDGAVVTGTLGADVDFGRLLAGVAVSLSRGDGTFDAPDVDTGKKGGLESTMTTVSPYLRFGLTERLSAWGLAGLGTGAMTIRFDDGAMEAIRTDIALRVGAVGARGALLTRHEGIGMDLALKADAFFVRTEWDKVSGETDTAADASRVRLLLEGGRSFSVSEAATFSPSLELGVRHDGGDAETGTGVEAGLRLALATSWGLTLEASVRGLLAHEASGYREWGASAALRFDPGREGLGLTASVAPEWGAAASGVERLWAQPTAAGLPAPDGAALPAGRFEAELGYGMPALRGRGVLTPYVRAGLVEGAQQGWQVGTRLALSEKVDLSVEASRRDGATDPEHAIALRAALGW